MTPILNGGWDVGHNFARTIQAKLGLIWFNDFRGEYLNVKVYEYDGQQMPSDGNSSRGLWRCELKSSI